MLKKIIPKLPDDFDKNFNKSTSNVSNNNNNNNQTQESEMEMEIKYEEKPLDRIFEDQVFAIVGKLSKYVTCISNCLVANIAALLDLEKKLKI